uniref:LIM domain-containing protein 1 n=1 Tax=Hucho hucho TaxID=62062 RepID=A0A4W5MVI5_9TELE
MDSQTSTDIYFGSCVRCSEAVYGVGRACQAMGKQYHDTCFTCSACSQTLKGRPFYYMSGRIFCEDDFLGSRGSGLGPGIGLGQTLPCGVLSL